MINPSTKIRIGTRASKLAMVQANEVRNLLITKTSLQENQIEIVLITTSGDKIQDRSLADIGGKGLFIKELEEALINNKIDIAVHSAKDVPPQLHENTVIAAFGKRKIPNDYFISKKFTSINNLPQGSNVGTSSARRKAILLKMRPDLQIVNFRGNVDTRLDKLSQGSVDATILAACGLERLQKNLEQQNIISVEDMLPSAGQGALAIQTRKNDDLFLQIVQKINDEESEICILCEREFLRLLNASCKTPISAYCKIESGNNNRTLNFCTTIFDFDGKDSFSTSNIAEIINGNSAKDTAINLAQKAAKETKEKAAKLLMKICA